MFNIRDKEDKFVIKVFASGSSSPASKLAGDEAAQERLIQSLEFDFESSMLQLFNQKEQVLEMQSIDSNGVILKFRVKWQHNQDLLKYDELKRKRQAM